MTTIRHILLFAGIMAIAIIPISSVDATSVFTFQMPLFEDWDEIQKVATSRSISSPNTDVDEEGSARLYAKDRSYVDFPQVSVEYTKIIIIERGDKLEIRQETYVDRVRFGGQNDAKESHLVALPTIHKVGESDTVGFTNQTGCDPKPDFEEITENTSKKMLNSKLICDSLSPGEYEISAYVHARSNDDSSRQNAYVYATVSEIELNVKRTR